MYKYHYRPGYGSQNLLIEIFEGPERKEFFEDLLSALKQINVVQRDVSDLWMNDELLYEFESDVGSFVISRNIYDLVFIMSDDNPQCIETIEALLSNDNRFEKVEVDLDNYKEQ